MTTHLSAAGRSYRTIDVDIVQARFEQIRDEAAAADAVPDAMKYGPKLRITPFPGTCRDHPGPPNALPTVADLRQIDGTASVLILGRHDS